MLSVEFLAPVEKFLKNLRDKQLKKEYEQGDVVVVIMAGTRENFWNTIKKYLR